MVKENPDRNFLVHELWKQGRTVDEISFETGIPRSTVGYYIRKFNQCAKSGKPIPITPAAHPQNDQAMALTALIKSSFYTNLVSTLAEPEEIDTNKMIIAPDNLDRVYKTFMILKLAQEFAEPGKPDLAKIIKTEQLDLNKMITAPDNLDRKYKALMIERLEKELTHMGKLNRVYKTLMIIKLIKELQTVIFPTQEEAQAFLKNLSKDLGQVGLSNKSA
jgi:hypothetical protein